MKKKIVIFGAGISSATMARKLAEDGYEVDVYETRNEIGGNCYDCKDKHGVLIQKYGPHVFHTNHLEVYKFISQFTKLNTFMNRTLASLGNSKIVPLPINYRSIEILFPKEATYIKKVFKAKFKEPKIPIFSLLNSKDPILNKVAKFIYENVYQNYSSKMWGVPVAKIDPNTLNRVPITNSYSDLYFPTDRWQGLPTHSFTSMIKNIFKHKNIHLHLKSPKNLLQIKNNKTYINKKLVTDTIFYCGSVDELYKYRYGTLPYRSLHITFKNLPKQSFQQAAVINYPADPTMTRISEYKKLTFQKIKSTTISKEYPGEFNLKSKKFNQRFYPISSHKNAVLYNKYLTLSKKTKNLILLGRLAQYKYFDMDDAILNTLNMYNSLKIR
jgi:UDP-galactopyranose mutase